MLRWRKPDKLLEWVKKASGSRFRFTARFAETLQRDREEVELAISMQWNNGPLEGQVNRLKTIKRQMYGRF